MLKLCTYWAITLVYFLTLISNRGCCNQMPKLSVTFPSSNTCVFFNVNIKSSDAATECLNYLLRYRMITLKHYSVRTSKR